MKKNDFLTKSLLLGTFALIGAACSNDDVASIISEEDAPTFSITLKTPAVSGVTVNNATRAEGDTVADETDEAKLNSVDIYLFSKGSGVTSTGDNVYTYSGKLSFAAAATDGVTAWTTESDKTVCTGKIPYDAMGKDTRFAIIANDGSVAQPTLNSTSLADFMAKTEASASVATGNTADALVGGETKSFPMSAVINDQSKSYVLTAAGNTEIDGEITLVRNVARIDIRNYATDLTITSVKVNNANSKSYIFSSSSSTINVPASPAAIETLKPLTEYTNRFTGGKLAYNSVSATATKEQIFAANTFRAFYLYEQAANTTGSENFTVEIAYSVNSEGAEDTAAKTGTVKVPFKTTDGTGNYKDIQRNHLYTIQLGNGTAVLTGEVKVKLVVKDWETGEVFEKELDPSADVQG